MKDSDPLHKPVTSILRNPHFNRDGTVQGYSQFTPEVFEQEGFNHEEEHKKWKERTTKQLRFHNQSKDKKKYKIPPITHSVYLTSDQNPNPMKDLYIDNYGKTSERLSTEDSNFVHYLWVNFDPNDPKYKDVIPEEIRSIPNLQISNIKEFEDHPLYQNTVDFLENGRASSKFVEASDLVRVMATEAKGGLYHDLDWKLYDAKEMIKYMKNFDFIGGREVDEWTSSIGNAMFAAKAQHPITKKLSQLIDRNLNEKDPDLLPDYIKYPQREFDRIISSSGPIAITMAYNLAGNKGQNRDLICPSKILFNADYARSHQTGDSHNRNELKSSWNKTPIKTIGGDQFSGNWGKTYLNPIKYKQEILNPFGEAIKNNDIEKFKRLLSKFEDETNQRILGDALKIVVEYNRMEMFDILLPKITNQDELGKALNKAAEHGNKEILNPFGEVTKNNDIEKFKRILSKFEDSTKYEDYINQWILGNALKIIVEDNRIEMFDILLPKITNQDELAKVLNKAAEHGNKEMFEALLPKITNQKELGKAFNKAVKHGHKEILNPFGEVIKDNDIEKFKRILSKFEYYTKYEDYINQWILGAALKIVVEDNRIEMFDILLPKITNQGELYIALSQAIEHGNKEMFDALLPKTTDKIYLNVALNQAIEHGNKEMFDALLPKVTDQSDLAIKLDKVIEHGNKEMFDALLPKVTDQDYLARALDKVIEHGNKEMFDALLPKVTDQSDLARALNKATEHGKNEAFDALLPKVTDQSDLVGALNVAVEHSNKEAFNALLPKVTDQSDLARALNKATEHGNKEAFNALLPKITGQPSLGEALNVAVKHGNKEAFDALLPKITNQDYLGRAIRIAEIEHRQDITTALKNHINYLNYKYYIGDNIDYATNLLSSAGTTLNNWLKKKDPLKIPGGAEAASVDHISHSNLSSKPHASATNALPAANKKESSAEIQVTQAPDGRFADTINERLFIGTAAVAVAMKAVGLNTDWAKPILGGGSIKLQMDLDPQNLPSHMNPEYDYLAKIEESAKKSPPFQKAALERVVELAQSEEASNLSREQWQNLIKDDKKMKALFKAVIEKVKIQEATARPFTQADLKRLQTLPKLKGNINRRG